MFEDQYTQDEDRRSEISLRLNRGWNPGSHYGHYRLSLLGIPVNIASFTCISLTLILSNQTS